MRTSLLLAAAAVIIPATSQAELLINGSWTEMAAHPNAVPTNISPSTLEREAFFRLETNGIGDRWQIDSLTLDGITPYFTSYTPSASNFSLSIYSQSTQTTVATVVASSVGAYVDNGDDTSRFSVTFTNIPSPAHPFGGIDMPGFVPYSSYEVQLNVINLNTLPFPDANFFTYKGFYLQGISPIMDGEVSGVKWAGPLPMVMNATNLGAPVPEPSTYGIVLGGLVLAGAVIRRRISK